MAPTGPPPPETGLALLVPAEADALRAVSRIHILCGGGGHTAILTAHSERMKVLVADHDPYSRMLLMRLLAEWGLEVISAQDGTEAATVLKSDESLSFLLIEDNLPGANPLDVCRKFRTQETGHNRKFVILLTGQSSESPSEEAIKAGVNVVVPKPINISDLKTWMEKGQRIVSRPTDIPAAAEKKRPFTIKDWMSK